MANKFGDELREWRESRKLTQAEAGELLGISRNYYSNFEYGQTVPDKILRKLSELGFGTPTHTAPRMVEGMKMVPVPVEGRVAAGDGEYSVDSYEEPLYVPDFMIYPGCKGRIIVDHSMFPRLEHGDTIIYNNATVAMTGKTFVLYSEDSGWQVKKLKWRQGIWYAHSINPAVEDFPIINHRLCGIVTGIYGKRDGAYYVLSQLDGINLKELDE